MSIETVLASMNINIDEVINQMCTGMSKDYFDDGKAITTTFAEPVTELPYFLMKTNGIAIDQNNLVPSKSEDADIDWDTEIDFPITNEQVETDPGNLPRRFSWHNKDMLVEKNGMPVSIQAIVNERTADTMDAQMKLAIKQLWYYLYLGDSNGVYTTLRVLSTERKNLMAKETSRPVRAVERIKLKARGLRHA